MIVCSKYGSMKGRKTEREILDTNKEMTRFIGGKLVGE